MPSINTPIPNNPFYYPQTYFLSTPSGSLIVGGGIFIDNITGTISAGGSGGGVVSTILAGSGIFASANVGGIVTITNTGVISLNAGPGIGITPGVGGSFTITNTLPSTPASGTVTSVATGPGLQGGPITTSGTIQLSPSGVAPGVYSNPTITVDAYGRITLASPGSPFGSGILATAPLAVTSTFPQAVSIAASSTSQAGAVQLNDTVTSTSTSQAATPRAVKVAYDLASTAATDATNALTSALNASNAASSAQILATTANTNAAAAAALANQKIPCACITGKGALITGTAANTPVAIAVGTDGQALVACAACASGLTWTTPAVSVVPATPTVAGIVLGCTTVSNTALGCRALSSIGAGTLNVALGTCAGCAITTGSQNVAIGPNSTVASATGSCQLAIGFSATDNWITGDSGKNVQFGAGIRDCANSVGTSTQVLTSTGTTLQWANSPGFTPSWTLAGTIQSVGWGATTTAPTIGVAVENAVYYRQLGPTVWEVMYSLEKTTSTGYTNGSGDYLFTLPAGLQWDTTLPFQKLYNADISVNNAVWYGRGIPYSNTTFYAVDSGASSNWTRFGMLIVPFSSTQFRVVNSVDTSTSMKPWGSTFYSIVTSDLIRTNFTFQVSTP